MEEDSGDGTQEAGASFIRVSDISVSGGNMGIVPRLAEAFEEEVPFKLGEPWRYSDKATSIAVPIIRVDKPPERSYVLLEEVADQVSFKDSGSIRKVVVEKGIDTPVLVRRGAILSGKTQPRMVSHTIVILPQAREVPVEVRCVSASTPISHRAKMRFVASAPVRVARMATASQPYVWEAVGSFASWTAGMATPTTYSARASVPSTPIEDNLVTLMMTLEEHPIAEVRKKIRKAIEVFPLVENQVGIVLLDEKGVAAVELFDHPDSWRAVAKDAGRKFVEMLVKEAEFFPFEPSMERIKHALIAFLKELAKGKEKLVSRAGEFETYNIKTSTAECEYVLHRGEPIYFVAYRIDEPARERRGRVVPLPLRWTETGVPAVLSFTTSTTWEPMRRVPTTAGLTWWRSSSTTDQPMRRLLEELTEPRTFREVMRELGWSSSTVSRRLNKLMNAGFVAKVERENGRPAYTLTAMGKWLYETQKRRTRPGQAW